MNHDVSRALRRARRAAVLGAAVVALTACGGSSDEPKAAHASKDAGGTAAAADTPGTSSARPTAPAATATTLTSVVFTPAAPRSAAALENTAGLMRRRAASLGLRGVRVNVSRGDITATAPGRAEKELSTLGRQARLDFRPVRGETPASADRCRATTAPAARPLTACTTNTPVVRYDLGPVAVPGTDVAAARARFDEQTATGWLVDVTFTSRGARRFADLTAALARQEPPADEVAIVLDGTVLSAPMVREELTGGKAQISGNFTRSSARELASLLTTGALPVQLKVSSVSHVPQAPGKGR